MSVQRPSCLGAPAAAPVGAPGAGDRRSRTDACPRPPRLRARAAAGRAPGERARAARGGVHERTCPTRACAARRAQGSRAGRRSDTQAGRDHRGQHKRPAGTMPPGVRRATRDMRTYRLERARIAPIQPCNRDKLAFNAAHRNTALCAPTVLGTRMRSVHPRRGDVASSCGSPLPTCALALGGVRWLERKDNSATRRHHAALAHPPVGCTHHLVFASHGSGSGGGRADLRRRPEPYTRELYETLLATTCPAPSSWSANVSPTGVERTRRAAARNDRARDGDRQSLLRPPPRPPGRGRRRLAAARTREPRNPTRDRLQPCLFRPPYGNNSPELVQRAKVLGLSTDKLGRTPQKTGSIPGATVSANVSSRREARARS